MGPSIERKRCTCRADLKRFIWRSRRRVGWWGFAARLLILCAAGGRCSVPYLGNRTLGSEFVCAHPRVMYSSSGAYAAGASLICDHGGSGTGIKDKAVLVHSPAEPVPLSVNCDYYLIKIPAITRSRHAPADAVGKHPTEPLGPAPHCLMVDQDTSCRQHLHNHPQAQRKAEIELHRETNHLGREMVASVEHVIGLLHFPFLRRHLIAVR